MTPCKQHVWRTRSSNHRYVVVACTACGEVRGAMPSYLSAEMASALAPSHEAYPRPSRRLPVEDPFHHQARPPGDAPVALA